MDIAFYSAGFWLSFRELFRESAKSSVNLPVVCQRNCRFTDRTGSGKQFN